MKTTTTISEEDKKKFDDFIRSEIKKGDLDTDFAKLRNEIRELKPLKDD